MRKFLFLPLIVLFSTFVYAQTADIPFDIGNVDLNFCDNANQLSLAAEAWSETGFCIVLNNLSNRAGTIKLSLVDWEMSVWESPVKACKMTSSGYFGQFVSFSWLNNIFEEITLSPGTWIVKRVNVELPSWFAGNLHGCLTYTVSNWGNKSWMFEIINRKANTIDISVKWNYVNWFGLMDMNLFSWSNRSLGSWDKKLNANSPVIVTRDGLWQVRLVLGIQNTWFATENFWASWTLYNKILWIRLFSKEIQINSGTIYGWDNVVIKNDIEKLPMYGGKYYVSIQINHTPLVETWLNILDAKFEPVNHDLVIKLPLNQKMIVWIVVFVFVVFGFIVTYFILRKRKTKTI